MPYERAVSHASLKVSDGTISKPALANTAIESAIKTFFTRP
jgi:hypothetical protein